MQPREVENKLLKSNKPIIVKQIKISSRYYIKTKNTIVINLESPGS